MRTFMLATAILFSGLPALAAGSSVLSGSGTAMGSRPGVLVAQGPVTRGLVTLEARQHQGAEALDVTGTAPANAPVTITLLATVSQDIPTIVVSRQDVVTDVNGRFGALVPIASAYERGTILRVVATSLPGVVPAAVQLVVTAPNAGVIVPLEQQTPPPAR